MKKITTHIIISISICLFLLLKAVMQSTTLISWIISNISRFGQDGFSIGIIGGSDGPIAIFISLPVYLEYVSSIIEFVGIAYVFVTLILSFKLLKNKK